MTIQECYKTFGGDYEQVLGRLPSEALVKRFIEKFPNDDSYAELCAAIADGDLPRAFRAAHTLKGVCANLSLDRLFASVSVLTELLRADSDTIPESAYPLLDAVRQDYALTVNTIHAFLEQG